MTLPAIPRRRVAQALGVTEDSLPPGDLPLERFAARYLDFLAATYETEAFDAHPDYWTDLLLASLVEDSPDLAFNTILATLAQAQDMDDIELIAAGPLEDLLGTHGAALLPRIDALAAAPRFRRALGALWSDGGGPPLLVARLRAVAGPIDPEDETLPPADGLI